MKLFSRVLQTSYLELGRSFLAIQRAWLRVPSLRPCYVVEFLSRIRLW